MTQEELKKGIANHSCCNGDLCGGDEFHIKELMPIINRHVKDVIGSGLPKKLGIVRVTIHGKEFLIEEGTKEVEIINGLIAEQKERAGL